MTPRRRALRFQAAVMVAFGCMAGLATSAAVAGDDAAVVPIPPVDLSLEPVWPQDPTATGGESFADPVGEPSTPVAPVASAAPGLAVVDELQGRTPAQIAALQARLSEERDAAAGKLVRLEMVRATAEARRDVAVATWTRHLVAAYQAGGGARLRALAAVREAEMGQSHDVLVAALDPLDRVVVLEGDAAAAAVERSAAAVEDARANVEALDERMNAAAAALDSASPEAADAPVAAAAGRTAVDADLIFATGPIPGIGYWGEVSGGGMLDGWMGYASAAVGGVGCTAPDPALAATSTTEAGTASWYGPGFDGHTTSNGEPFDEMAMTAAHRTLPFGTIVRVTSTTTARCAFVRINDRGPFVDERIIDLSRAAANQVGLTGISPVQLEVWAAPATAR